MTTVNDQIAMWNEAERRSANANEAFLWLVSHGMTASDLRRNIERRPSLWERFSSWLDVLP